MTTHMIVVRTEITHEGFTRKHICANGLTSDDRAQFVRREWWKHHFGSPPEGLAADLLPEAFRRVFFSENDSEFIYHPRKWERAIAIGESHVIIACLYQHETSARLADLQGVEQETYLKIIAIITADSALTETVNIVDFSSDPEYHMCQ
jgi:hypothetical protein